MTRGNSAVRSTVFSSIGIYTEFLFGMVVSILIARHLQPAGFGAYSAIIWMVSVCVVFTNSGTATAAIRFVAELRGGDQMDLIAPLLEYLKRVQLRFLMVVLAVGGVALLVAGNRVIPEVSHVLLFLFLSATVSIRAIYMFNIGVVKGFQDFRATAVVAVASAPVTLVMVAMAVWLSAPIGAFLWIFVVSSMILLVVSHRQSRAAISASKPGGALPANLLIRVKRHVRLTAMTVTLGYLVGSEIEVLFLQMYATGDAAGNFKVAYQLGLGAAALVPGVFGAVLLPMMASALKQGRQVAAKKFVASTRYLAFLSAPLIAFGVLFSAEIIYVMYGPAYASAAPLFAVCIAAGSLLTTTQGASSLLISADRQGSILALVAILVVVKIVLDLVLIIGHGLQGAISAYLVVALLYMTAIMALAIRSSGMGPEWSVLSRIGLAAAISGATAYALVGHAPPLISVLLGGALVGALYFPITLALNCWSHDDVAYMHGLNARLGDNRFRLIGRILEYAMRRARR